MDKTVEEVGGWKVKGKMEKWEKKQVDELRVKKVDKLM